MEQDAVRRIMITGTEIPLGSAKCAKKRMPGHATIVKSAMMSPIVQVIVPVGMTQPLTLQKTARLGGRFIGIWYKRAATNEREGAVRKVR